MTLPLGALGLPMGESLSVFLPIAHGGDFCWSPESSQLELYAFNALLIILSASFLTSSPKPWRFLLNTQDVVGERGFFSSLLYSFGSWALSHCSLPCRSGPCQLVLPCVVLPRGMAATTKGLLTLSEMSKFFYPPPTTTP